MRAPDWLIVWDFKEGLTMLGVARRYGLKWAEVEQIVRGFNIRKIRAPYVKRRPRLSPEGRRLMRGEREGT